MARGAKKTLKIELAEVACRLLAWYGRTGRDLPWRQTRDPYRIWLSEIMLQQTTVAAVIPYYQRFLNRFPTIADLASASLDEVLELWAGLGYYSRARNLHQAAQRVVTEFAGVFPDTVPDLMALPGVGRSTAGAIVSIAYDRPAPILDGNVRRVLVRLFAWTDNPRSTLAEKQLWQWAELLTPTEQPHNYAQAIMDLGATVCTPRQPACGECPLRELCQAFEQGLVEVLPVRRRQAKLPVRHQVTLLIASELGLLVQQRPPQGLLGGLWEFPCLIPSAGQNPAAAARALSADLGLSGKLFEIGVLRHAYSHFKLELTVFCMRVETLTRVAEPGDRWCTTEELLTLPLHGAHRKAYELYENRDSSHAPRRR